MAKNWTMAEAIKAIAEQNMEDVKDIYRRFPTFAMMATRAVSGDNEAACNIIASLPEWATVNKFEKAIKNDVETTEEAADDEQEDVAEPEEEEVVPEKTKKAEKKPAKKTKAEKPEEKAKLTGGKAYEMVKAAGKLKDMKAKGFGTKAADYIAYAEEYLNSDEDFEEVVPEAETDEYADKSVMDLFKECKKAGIKAAPKKDKSYYIALLKKANEDPEPDTDDDDWDEIEPEVEEKPKKAKAEKKPAKKAKPAPKVEEEEDDEEDWDI